MNGVTTGLTGTSPRRRLGFALSDLIPTRSLIMTMEPTGLDEDCQLFRVRKSQSLLTRPPSLSSTTVEKCGHQGYRGVPHGQHAT